MLVFLYLHVSKIFKPMKLQNIARSKSIESFLDSENK